MHAEKKVKVTKKMNIYFPSAIVEEIIARLPTKSLARILCMSKEWYSYRSNGKLDKLRSKLAPLEIRILDPEASGLHRSWDFDDFLTTPAPLSFPLERPNFPTDQWIGSCNGLVCVALDQQCNQLVLWNPTTGVYRQLPDKPVDTSSYAAYPVFGFGYDSVSDDYKIFLSSIDDRGYEDDISTTLIYSLRANSWKEIYTEGLGYVDKGLFLNGALHWDYNGKEIVVFDLEKEVIHDFLLPPLELNILDKARQNFTAYPVGLGIVGGYLSVSGYDSRLQIWIMKEYGVQESWVRIIELATATISEVYYKCDDLLPQCINDQGYMVIQHEKGINLIDFNLERSDTAKLYPLSFPSEGALLFTAELTSPFCFSNGTA
ncbi:hypothetical protein Tsubulata_034255 [Turnera subulata]|uniref:F-box domain-containing protein n=1 Tax=Turnera subulata TaxID=218843 RepID=A0A9Q0G8P3_9ROSI|nr:hypothetical protein Tsubulata_034255 [Turnera subulata]